MMHSKWSYDRHGKYSTSSGAIPACGALVECVLALLHTLRRLLPSLPPWVLFTLPPCLGGCWWCSSCSSWTSSSGSGWNIVWKGSPAPLLWVINLQCQWCLYFGNKKTRVCKLPTILGDNNPPIPGESQLWLSTMRSILVWPKMLRMI